MTPTPTRIESTAVTELADTTFTRMQDATEEDYLVVATKGIEWNVGLADRVLTHLELLHGETGGYAVDRLEHSLQSATRAERDGKDQEYIVCALLHDIGDSLASLNHASLAAAIVQPYVSEENHWIVEHHGIFQGYYFFHHWGLDRNMRQRYAESPHYRATVEFCAKYDQNCFDPEYASETLEHFVPMVQEVFANPQRSIYLD